MSKKSGTVIRLIGELRTRGADWDMPEFTKLFTRLEAGTGPGVITRYMRYYGEADERTEVRFFGFEVESFENIPEGMVALELGENTFTVYEMVHNRKAITWQGNLAWDWLDHSRPEAPVGDFMARVPSGWTSRSIPPPLTFTLSANACFERGRAPDDDVQLVAYDPTWPAKFEEMAEWLRKTVSPGIATRIEHYGSTAILGMPAKPVIDILLEIPSFAAARHGLIPIFNRPECEYWWYDDHMVFIIRSEFMGTRTYHLHAAPPGHRVWEGIVFRDYLRTHPDEARQYANLKHELAGRHTTDREAYTDNKENFVRGIIEKARGTPDR